MTEVTAMAIAMTIRSGTATVRIDDSCCTGLTPEELARRRAAVDRAIWQINRRHAQRAAERKERKETTC